jgi:hypothetical protein
LGFLDFGIFDILGHFDYTLHILINICYFEFWSF